MKKRLFTIILCVLTMMLVLAFASCSDTGGGTTITDTNSDSTDTSTSTNTNTNSSTQQGCKHTLTSIPQVDATCEQVGFREGKKCIKCYEVVVQPQEIPALGHSMKDKNAKEPTCEESGWEEYEQCARCDYNTKEELPPLNHALETVEGKESTCDKAGWEEYEQCTRCDYNTKEELPLLNHVLETVEGKEATCDKAGWEEYEQCTRCDYNTKERIPKLGHDMEFVERIEATCMSGGWDEYACTRDNCDIIERRHETDPSYAPDAHDFQEAGVAPTCTTVGYEDLVCTRCGSSAGGRNIIPALGHTYEREDFDGETGVSIVSATCEANGYIVFTCMDCESFIVKTYDDLIADGNTELAEMLKQLGHNFDVAWDESNILERCFPTCTISGYEIRRCQNEGCFEYIRIFDGYEALGHTYERDTTASTWTYETTLEPTCISPGASWVVCTEDGCGHNTEDDYMQNPYKYSKEIAPIGMHVFDLLDSVVPPTCEHGGYTLYRCSNDIACFETEERDVTPPSGHDWALDETCLKDGKPFCKTAGKWSYYCTVCSETGYNVKEGDETIADAVHTGYTRGDFYGGIAPTCVTPGQYYCSVCEDLFYGYEDDELAAPTGMHTFNSVGTIVPSTCSSYGYTVYKCTNDVNCVATENRDYMPLTSHIYTDPAEDGGIVCFECEKSYRDITTAIETTIDIICTCGMQGTKSCKCDRVVEIVAIKVPDPAFEIDANETFIRDGFADVGCGPALIVLHGEANTVYTVTAYDEDGNIVSTYDIVVNGEVVGEASVETTANGEVAYINLDEIAYNIDTVEITASTNATVQMYYPIS